MEFAEKARESLEAAGRLLPDEGGARDALSNSAASRAYYAAYLAVADRAQRDRRPMTGRGGTWYRHDTLPGDAQSWGLVDEDGAEDLHYLYGLRVKADYQEDMVSLEEASTAFAVAERMVFSLLKDVPQ